MVFPKYNTIPKRRGTIMPQTILPFLHAGANELSEKTDRDVEDAQAKMGTACTRPVERVLAAVGASGGATTSFENCRGVDFGGVLCALPALITNGLLEYLDSCFEELEKNPHLSRFILVFDREGYSPGFFKEMWQKHRICCITYHKHPKGKWPEEEFQEDKLRMPGGQIVKMKLAERGSLIGSKEDMLWACEMRKMTKSGTQTSVISPGQANLKPKDCKWLFSRWSQENFFRYMMQEFAIGA